MSARPAAATLVCVCLLVLTSCMTTSDVPSEAKSELTPTGTLRAALNLSNPILVATDGSSADLRGIAPAVASELASRLDVPVQFVPYPSAAAVADDVASAKWDVAFIGADPAREGTVAFTSAYIELSAAYLVPAGSRIQSAADVDVSGVRFAARPRTAYDLALRRTLKHASLVYPADTETDIDLVKNGRADVLAGLRSALLDTSRTLPGSRVLDGDAAAIQQSIAVPRGRQQALRYLEEFVAEITKGGFVAELIEQTGARGARVPKR